MQDTGIFDMFSGLLTGGRTPEEAAATLRGIVRDPAAVDEAVSYYREICEGILSAREPAGLRDGRNLTPWYVGPRPADSCWPALRLHLEAEGFDPGALRALDLASTKVVAQTPPPWKPEFSGRGLVLGYVQSGKTSNFTAVAAKAADAGYRLVVVLSGIHNNLRHQTQARLDAQLVNLNPTRWIKLTNEEADFGDPGNADAFLSQTQMRLLVVVKKNKSRLERLIGWLRTASVPARANCPILIIDDEADQASVNARDALDRTVINKLILELLAQPKVAYVGYTATPFANVFIDPAVPEDLYPRDFIVDLPRPPEYFGPERLFGREPLNEDEDDLLLDGLDVVRLIGPDEVASTRPPRRKAHRSGWEPDPGPGLTGAVRWFLLATAARAARGQSGRHSSMLVHTTQLADMQERFREPLEAEFATVGAMLRTGHLDQMRTLWTTETGLVPAELTGQTPIPFEEVVAHLPEVLARARVVVDNYRSTERLDYGAGPEVVVVVGGNTLSRGLTLEGLVVSYFLRAATAYDTLLQMGRWFGYRPGYADLPRIWTTYELAEYFQFLATVEAEIRLDVSRYEKEDMTPLDFAVRIRTHPKLAVTSALKMQATVDAQVSYSGRRLQTILFNHRDRAWLQGNLRAARALLDRCAVNGPAAQLPNGRHLFTDVPAEVVKRFLLEYQFHPDSVDLVADRIISYIGGQLANGELASWSVAVIGTGKQDAPGVEVGGGVTTSVVTRAAMRAVSKPHANIKTLMSREDRVVDLDLSASELADLDDEKMQSLRPPGRALLALYIIDKGSQPRKAAGPNSSRVPLDAVEHMVGIGLVFPDALRMETTVNYKAVALPAGEMDDDEEPSPDDIDVEGDLNDVVA